MISSLPDNSQLIVAPSLYAQPDSAPGLGRDSETAGERGQLTRSRHLDDIIEGYADLAAGRNIRGVIEHASID